MSVKKIPTGKTSSGTDETNVTNLQCAATISRWLALQSVYCLDAAIMMEIALIADDEFGAELIGAVAMVLYRQLLNTININ